MSDVERKNAESIAYRHDQERKEMQYLVGLSAWDHGPLFVELATQVGRELGRSDGVIVFDPSSFPKKWTESVGRATAMVRPVPTSRRQHWCISQRDC